MIVAASASTGKQMAVAEAVIWQTARHLLAGADGPVPALKAPAPPSASSRQGWVAIAYRTRAITAETLNQSLTNFLRSIRFFTGPNCLCMRLRPSSRSLMLTLDSLSSWAGQMATQSFVARLTFWGRARKLSGLVGLGIVSNLGQLI